MDHEDDDRHDKEPAPHNTGFFKTSSSIQEDVTDGDQWIVSVISPEEPQRDEPTGVPINKGWRRAPNYCLVSANRTPHGKRSSNHRRWCSATDQSLIGRAAW